MFLNRSLVLLFNIFVDIINDTNIMSLIGYLVRIPSYLGLLQKPWEYGGSVQYLNSS